MKINIISRDNLAGLSAGTEILTGIFRNQGWQVDFNDYKSLKRFSFWNYRHYDLNLFIQWANPTWMRLARANILIPNPEWFKEKWMRNLSRFDRIFCKTRQARAIFSAYNPHAVFTSFTSRNKHLEIKKNHDQWLHLPGKSKLKGTEIIIDTWLKNPHFPHLTIVQRNAPNHVGLKAGNLTYISEYVNDSEAQRLMNTCAVHLCPSSAEGFGHYIGEALSCGALIISTGGAPMNELVSEERGVLIQPVREEKMRLSQAYFIDPQGLEKAVQEVMEMSQEHREMLMKNARDFYMENDSYFRETLVEEIKKL
jgi:hypothetical protein